ncbi:MAG: hypothetical protein M3O09_16745 [Acidobacteriota bacterium]|nr:hypothetical protein [Acidobacteriota bacterium]
MPDAFPFVTVTSRPHLDAFYAKGRESAKKLLDIVSDLIRSGLFGSMAISAILKISSKNTEASILSNLKLGIIPFETNIPDGDLGSCRM